MSDATSALPELPAWRALAAHHQQVRRLHLRDLFAQDAKRGERMTAEAAGLFLDYSKNRITGDTLPLLLQLAAETGLREDRRHVSRRQNQRHRETGRPARCPACPGRRVDRRRWRKRRAAGTRRSRQDGRFRQSHPRRRVARAHRQAHSQRRQHRHRRFRSGPGDGVRGAQSLQRSRHDASASSPTSTAPISSKRPAISTRPKLCSSFPPRRSRRWRR